MRPLIRLENVTKTYRVGQVDLQVLKGISVGFEEGEFASIVGASGSGKSTLLHILGCLDTPTSGACFFGEDNVAGLDDDALSEIRNRNIGFVFQTFNLIPHLNVLENVEVPLFYAGASRQERQRKCREAIGLVDLGQRLDHAPAELSGGECQRVAIARAIAHEPRVILADEPTGNLDSATGAEILKIFNRLHEMKKTIVMVTHDREIAARTERQIVMRDGEVT
jgi:putative ABC transport system ATP-binding protein